MGDGLIAVAVGAGLLAAVNPCGFALLPAYVSMLVTGTEQVSRSRALGRALALTASMTAGFVAVFAVFGLAIAPVASSLQQYLPWFTLVLGAGLAIVGALMLAGRSVALPRLPGRRGGPAKPVTLTFGSMAGFGVAYALASLTCTIAPFLAVVVGGLRSGSVLDGLALFLAYAAGMGLVVGTVAVATALASTTIVRFLRRTGSWLPRALGAVLLVSGAYVGYYGAWELRVLAGADTADPVIGAASSLQLLLANAVAAPGPFGWALAGVVLAVAVTLSAKAAGPRSGASSPSTAPPRRARRPRR